MNQRMIPLSGAYGCTGEGANSTQRVDWAVTITNPEQYSIEAVLSGKDSWDAPSALVNKSSKRPIVTR